MPASLANPIDAKACYIHPLGDRVLIRPVETATEIKGILVPKAVKEARDAYVTEGEVIDVGPEVPFVVVKDEAGNEREEPKLKPGDRVVFSRYSGHEVPFVDGTRFLLIPERDICGLLDPACPVLDEKKVPEFQPPA